MSFKDTAFYKEHMRYQRLRYVRMIVFIMLACAIVATPTIIMYNNEGSEVVTIHSINEQQKIYDNGDGVSTTYYYLVNTDKGTFEISPDGIFYSNSFGVLKEGKTYEIHTRGIRFPILGYYPYIIEAKEI